MTHAKPGVSVDQEQGFIDNFPQNGKYLKIDKIKMISELTNKIWIMKNPVETQQQVGELLDVIVTLELEQKQKQSQQQESNIANILSELLGTIEARFQTQKSTAQQYSLIILNQLKACALIHPSIANLICGCKSPNSILKEIQMLTDKIFDLLTTLPTRDLRESVAQVIRAAALRKGEKEQVALQTVTSLSEVLQNFWKDGQQTQINQQSELYFTYSSPFCSIPDSPVLSPFSQLSSQPIGQIQQTENQSNEFNETRRITFLLSCQQYISSQIDNIFRSVEEAQKGKQKIDPTNQGKQLDSLFSLFAFLLQHNPQSAFKDTIIQREQQQDQVDERERCIFGSEKEGRIGVPLFFDINQIQTKEQSLSIFITNLIKLLLLYLQKDKIKQNETKKLSPIEYNSNALAVSRLILTMAHTNSEIAKTISKDLTLINLPFIVKKEEKFNLIDYIISKIQFFLNIKPDEINKDNAANEDVLISQLLSIIFICSIENVEMIHQQSMLKLVELLIQKLMISSKLPVSAHIALLQIKHIISFSFATNNEEFLQLIFKSAFEQDNKFKPLIKSFEIPAMRILEELFIPSQPFIIEKRSSQNPNNDQNDSVIPSLNGTVILFTKPFNQFMLQTYDKNRPQLNQDTNEEIMKQITPQHLNIIQLILTNDVLLNIVLDLFTKFLITDNDYMNRQKNGDAILESTFLTFNFFIVSCIEYLNKQKEKKLNEKKYNNLINILFRTTLLLTTPKHTLKIRAFSLHLSCIILKNIQFSTIDLILLIQDLLKSINAFYSTSNSKSQIDTKFSLSPSIQQQQKQAAKGSDNDNEEIIRIFGQGFIEFNLLCLEQNAQILKDADAALKQRSKSREQKDLLETLNDKQLMSNDIYYRISNTTRIPNTLIFPNKGVAVHRHRVSSLLEMILFFLARYSDLPAPLQINVILPEFFAHTLDIFSKSEMSNFQYIGIDIPLLSFLSINDIKQQINSEKIAQINQIAGIIRNSQDLLSFTLSTVGYQPSTYFYPTFLFHALIKQPELIVQLLKSNETWNIQCLDIYQAESKSMKTLWALILALLKKYHQIEQRHDPEDQKKECFKQLLIRICLIQSIFGNHQDFVQVISSDQKQYVQQLTELMFTNSKYTDLGQLINESSNVLLGLSEYVSNPSKSQHLPQPKPKEKINSPPPPNININPTPYLGIYNPKFMCYIISTLQQLFMHRQFRDSMLSWDGKFWGSQKQPQTTTDVQPSIRPQRPSTNPTRERIQLPEEKLEVEQFKRAKADALRDVNLRTTNQGTFEELQKLFIELQNGPNTNGISRQVNQVPTLNGFLDKYRDVSGMRINENEQQDVNLFLTSLFDHLEIHLDCLEMHNFVRRYFRCFLSEQQICVNGHLANNAQRQKIITIQMSGVSSLYASLGRLNRGQFAQGLNCSECQEKGLGNNALIKRTLLQTLPNTIIFNIARVDYDIKQQKAVKDKSRFTFPFGFNQKNRTEQKGKNQNEEDQLDDILDLTPFTREAVLKNEASVKDNQERYQLIKKKINDYKADEQKDNDIRSYPTKTTSYDNIGRGEQYYKFRLVGVVVHSGNATGGHYYSYVRERSPPFRWIKFNDERTQYIAFRDEIKKQRGSSSSSQQSNVQELITSFDSQYQMMEEECFGGSRPIESLNPDLRANLRMQHSAGRELMKEMLKRDNTACMIIYERIQPIDDWAFELELIPQNIQQQQTPQNKYPRNQQGVFNFSNLTEINQQPDPVIERDQQLKTVNQVQVPPKPTTQVPPQPQQQPSTNAPPKIIINQFQQSYACHLLEKLDKNEKFEQKHFDWISLIFPDIMVEYNQKNQIDQPIFLRVLLNTIKNAEISPSATPIQQQIVSAQSIQPQSQQILPKPTTQVPPQIQQQPGTNIPQNPNLNQQQQQASIQSTRVNINAGNPNLNQQQQQAQLQSNRVNINADNPNLNQQQQQASIQSNRVNLNAGNPNLNQQQQQASIQSNRVNLNAANQNIVQPKDYAGHLLGKLDRNEIFEQRHIDWIFQFYQDKTAEFNLKNQTDKSILLRVLLNTIIQQAEVSPPTISAQQQIESVQSNPHQQNQPQFPPTNQPQLSPSNPPQLQQVLQNQPQSYQVPPQPTSQTNIQVQQQPKTYIKSPPLPNTIPNPNINPQQQQGMLPVPSSFQVNINFGIHTVAEVKGYANYLLEKQNRGEIFTDDDINWILQFCHDKKDQYNNAKSQPEKFNLIYAILKAIIQKAEASSPSSAPVQPK